MQANVKVAAGPARGAEGEALAPRELAAWRGMLRAHADLTREMDAELRARHGITLSAYELLMLLGEAPRRRLRVSELSAATLLTLSGVSRMVDRLARAGLVEREACEEDGRGAEVALTPVGRGRLRAARASHLADVRLRFLSRFRDDELEAMAGFWRRLGADGGPPA
jgi:DNA-binding MarR family transcriptional regulator